MVARKKRYELKLERRALKAMKDMPEADRLRVAKQLDALREDPYPPESKALQGMKPNRRVRVGRYRIVYQCVAERLIVYVVDVGHRREIYRRRPGRGR